MSKALNFFQVNFVGAWPRSLAFAAAAFGRSGKGERAPVSPCCAVAASQRMSGLGAVALSHSAKLEMQPFWCTSICFAATRITSSALSKHNNYGTTTGLRIECKLKSLLVLNGSDKNCEMQNSVNQ